MAVVVLKVVALVFQCVERLVFDLPARTPTSHELVDVAPMDPQVRHPTDVLHLVLAHLPVLEEIAPHVLSRAIEWHIVAKAKPMHQTGGALMPLVRADATRFGGRFYLLEQRGMIACFDAEDIMTANWLRVLDTAERPQIDQGICHQLHPIVSLLD